MSQRPRCSASEIIQVHTAFVTGLFRALFHLPIKAGLLALVLCTAFLPRIFAVDPIQLRKGDVPFIDP